MSAHLHIPSGAIKLDLLAPDNINGFSLNPTFVSASEADAFMNRMMTAVEWEQVSYKFGNRLVSMPRKTAYYGDAAAEYTYSGVRNTPRPWTPDLIELRQRIDAYSGMKFNAVLLNLYRDGKDSVAWHADREPELGPDPQIASLTLGTSRRFEVRPVGGDATHYFNLSHGSLLLMGSGSQLFYQHQVPKEPGIKSQRINLTFRLVNA